MSRGQELDPQGGGKLLRSNRVHTLSVVPSGSRGGISVGGDSDLVLRGGQRSEKRSVSTSPDRRDRGLDRPNHLLALTTCSPIARAHTANPSHYYLDCSTGHSSYNAVGHVARSPGSYKSVRSEVSARVLYPCTSPSSTNNGWSIVAAANGQNDASGIFVQFGYAKQACNGNCQNGFSNGVMDFWFTAFDSTPHYGEIFEADWVDLNGDGYHDLPTIGHLYQFTIDYISSQIAWKFTVDDVSAGTTYYTNVLRSCSCYLSKAWWGVETYNDAGAFGARAEDQSLAIVPMQFLNSNGSIYTTVTDQSACSWKVTGPYPAPDHWLSEHCTMQAGGQALNAYQAFHN